MGVELGHLNYGRKNGQGVFDSKNLRQTFGSKLNQEDEKKMAQ